MVVLLIAALPCAFGGAFLGPTLAMVQDAADARARALSAAALIAEGIPAAAMTPAYAALEDPQLRARDFFEAIDNAYVGRQEYPTWPMRMSAGSAT